MKQQTYLASRYLLARPYPTRGWMLLDATTMQPLPPNAPTIPAGNDMDDAMRQCRELNEKLFAREGKKVVDQPDKRC